MKDICRPILWPECKRILQQDPIEHIWNWMRKEIDAMEHVDSVSDMKKVFEQVWESLSLEKINAEIEKLPLISWK